MTAKVYQFRSKEDRKPKTKKQPPTVFEKSNMDIFRDVMDDVLGEWQAAAGRDQLNEYIIKKIPAVVRSSPRTDYVKDITELSCVEQRLQMKIAIFYPGCTTGNKIGWLAAFHINKEIFATPPDMASEGYARAICIVLFVEFSRHMKSLGRI